MAEENNMAYFEHDEKFGDLVDHVVVADEISRPVLVAVILHRKQHYLEIRSMYSNKDNPDLLRHGKGVRIPVEEGVAEQVLLVAQALMFEHGLIDTE